DIPEAGMLALQCHHSRRIGKVIFVSRRHHYDHATQAVGHSGRLDQGSRRSETRARGQKSLQSSRISRGECAERPRDHHLVTGFTPHGPAARLAAVDLRDQYADLAVVTRRISYRVRAGRHAELVVVEQYVLSRLEHQDITFQMSQHHFGDDESEPANTFDSYRI